jgi:hypothetical protein
VKVRKTRIVFPVFHNYVVCLTVASDIDKAVSRHSHLKAILNETNSNRDPCVFTSDTHRCYMFLPPNAKASTIAHECWHALQGMLDFVNIKTDHECVAYHLGYLVQKVHNFVHKGK